MKICFVGSAKSIHIKRWVKWFVEQGHEIHLISPNYEKIEGVKIYKIGGKEGSITNFFKKMMQTRKLVWKIKPDILHAHYAFGYGTFAAFANYHPFIVSVWGSDVLVETKESKIKKLLIKWVLKRADAIVPTAEFMKDYLSAEFGLPPDKITRIPWGIDLNIFHKGYEREIKKLREKLKIDKNAFVVLSNRHLSPKYNIENIIMAIPTVVKIYSNTVFIFIRGYGDIDFENRLKEKIKKMGIESNVKFIGDFITPTQMAVFLNTADIVISIPKTDQFASSVLEGMVCGAIPIVSEIEVYKQYLENKKNAFLVNPDNPVEIAEKIIYCIEHPKIKEDFYNINKKIVEENENWEKNAIKMEKLYKRLIGASK